ncbi:Tyrosine aminotransferase [Bradyrhizobium sp. ORS 285]|uniref:amino acid aminotransferase n=1 Tax=Bradyrhizobium sp. ORS 285 TaxID=115808 RepID=UPI000240684F|nr:amino acid aminotransferase [Bradyrhizobium sp. ORS 285]CCD89531.1 putative aminotransferase (class-I pyridoxal-phosphate-dependent and class II); aspartate aminotransferase, tyrosine aminotransferase or aromatic amino acid aminotransferase [Bradyrhizobium sp. ORS 285]SMX58778.1 Tyrosine aminotransferase [Bradyrhizobium sp. ORS 285]
MFERLSRQPDDPLLALIGIFKADPRADKVDLGVGVYRDEAGHSPIFRAVKAAERMIWESQDSKAYVAPEGDQGFLDLLWTMVGGKASPVQAAGVQTPGGSGALRLAADLIRQAGTGKIWLGLPSWPNHAGIFAAVGLEIETYPYFDVPSQTLLLDGMLEALQRAQPGDAVLLHASCHNPTGTPLGAAEWARITEVIAARGLVPLIDSAYQGFGAGFDGDVAGLRAMIAAIPEALVAVSCSKSFGLYRERTGALFAVAASEAAAATARSNLVAIARTSYSMPPDHGAAIVRTILGTPELYDDWRAELESMRERLVSLRRAFAEALGDRWSNSLAIGQQEGMFSLLPLSPAEVMALREKHGVYMPTSGRINIAGLKLADVARVAGLFKAI